MIELAYLVQNLLAVVRRCHLISRHSAEQRVGPTGALASALIILGQLLT